MNRLIGIAILAAALTGCANMTTVQKGASIGALAGAAIGGPWGHAAAGISGAQGAALGAVTGGLLGAVAADSLTRQPGYGACPTPVLAPPMVPVVPPKRPVRAEQTIEK